MGSISYLHQTDHGFIFLFMFMVWIAHHTLCEPLDTARPVEYKRAESKQENLTASDDEESIQNETAFPFLPNYRNGQPVFRRISRRYEIRRANHWQIYFRSYVGVFPSKWCTSFLIHKNWLITSASCLPPEPYGYVVIYLTVQGRSHVLRRRRKHYKIHPHYIKGRKCDIGMISMTSMKDVWKSFSLASIDYGFFKDSWAKKAANCFIYGIGTVNAQTIETSTIMDRINLNIRFIYRDKIFTTGKDPTEGNACDGYEGSAFVCYYTEMYVVVGILSTYAKPCTPQGPLTFTRAYNYATWVGKMISRGFDD